MTKHIKTLSGKDIESFLNNFTKELAASKWQ